MAMDEGTVARSIYKYKIGELNLLFTLFVAVLAGFSGLYLALATMIIGATATAERAIGAIVCFGMFFILSHWIRRDHRSSKEVVLEGTKVQRPMTKGDRDDDFVFFSDVRSLEVVNDYQDNGPALVLVTRSETIAYRSMYFESQAKFLEFSRQFDDVLKSGTFTAS
ncbi:hypothetical protein [Roseobacter sinensis]|uniref:YcxB-like protein domain-containing protein n=1 Tax=Roseobacter sinensis TaxID=2931391 RepID=A0ABT3BEY0_9RHOB|nr:hypothetical protein [Roseobacter sp. WL0113]MCV3272134.1 hypothetical protein [Roseobacter sp. WL0113]